MGGPLVYRTAAVAARPHRAAAVTCHGGGLVTQTPASPHLLIPKMKAEVYSAVAANDDAARAHRQGRAEEGLRRRRQDRPRVEVYDGCNHGWCVKGSAVYNEAGAETGLGRSSPPSTSATAGLGSARAGRACSAPAPRSAAAPGRRSACRSSVRGAAGARSGAVEAGRALDRLVPGRRPDAVAVARPGGPASISLAERDAERRAQRAEHRRADRPARRRPRPPAARGPAGRPRARTARAAARRRCPPASPRRACGRRTPAPPAGSRIRKALRQAAIQSRPKPGSMWWVMCFW